MRRAALILLVIAILSSVAVGAYLWVNAFVLSIYGYRSPVQDAPVLSQERTTPLAKQVVLVLVDGLRYDTSFKMPHLNQLRQGGAQARLLAGIPSTTQTAWVTLISGAGPEVNDTPLFERGGELLRRLTTDQLFAAAHRAGLTTGISGFQWWEKLLPVGAADLKYYADQENDAADSRVVDHALVFIEQFEPNFLLVNLRQVQQAGQTFGGDSPEYDAAALRCDEYIRRLAAALDPQNSVLVVGSSHGFLDAEQASNPEWLRPLVRSNTPAGPPVVGETRGYGGDEPAVLTTPWVLAGESVAPGDYGTLDQTDLAPILATLLGTPVPGPARGSVPMHMVPMGIEDKAAKLLALAQQRLRIGDIYLYSIGQGTLSQTPKGDLSVAQSSMAVKNYQSAAELATLSVEQTEREIARARERRLWAERLARAPVMATFLVPLVVAWLRRRKQLAFNVLAGLMAAALYHLLFERAGGEYTFSRIPPGGLAATLQPGLLRAAISVAAGGLLVALWMWHERERSLYRVAYASYSYALVLLYWIGLPLAACAWWSGVRFSWYVPNLTIAYGQFTLLMQAMLTAAIALVLPLPVCIVQRLLLALSDWRARARNHKEA